MVPAAAPVRRSLSTPRSRRVAAPSMSKKEYFLSILSNGSYAISSIMAIVGSIETIRIPSMLQNSCERMIFPVDLTLKSARSYVMFLRLVQFGCR